MELVNVVKIIFYCQTKFYTMLNYKKLMELNPTVYSEMVNSLGQKIQFVEHPIHGGDTFVVCVCHELELADLSTFYETGDMVADHKEYEPSFQNGKLFIGDGEAW